MRTHSTVVPSKISVVTGAAGVVVEVVLVAVVVGLIAVVVVGVVVVRVVVAVVVVGRVVVGIGQHLIASKRNKH